MKASYCWILLLVACSTAPVSSGTDASAQDEVVHTRLVGSDLRILPAVDTTDTVAKEAIACLRRFLEHKLDADVPNDYWYTSDLADFGPVYPELLYAEFDGTGMLHFWPTLTAIMATEDRDKVLLSVQWVADHGVSDTAEVRYAFEFLARRTEEGMRLSFPLAHHTRTWERQDVGNVHYIISPRHRFSNDQAGEQQRDIDRLSRFFEVPPFPITYYSFESATALFRAKGYRKHPLMNRFPTGGMVDQGGNVYSGNNKDIYTHEIVHLFVKERFGAVPHLLNEGVATLLGGSVEHDYAWHRANLARYLEQHPDVDLADRMNTFTTDLIEEQTSVPYLVGALLCERILRTHGKDGLFHALASGTDHWQALEPFGISRDNLNDELREVLASQLMDPW